MSQICQSTHFRSFAERPPPPRANFDTKKVFSQQQKIPLKPNQTETTLPPIPHPIDAMRVFRSYSSAKLITGIDPISVDAADTKLLAITWNDIEHIRLAGGVLGSAEKHMLVSDLARA